MLHLTIAIVIALTLGAFLDATLMEPILICVRFHKVTRTGTESKATVTAGGSTFVENSSKPELKCETYSHLKVS